MQYCKRCVMPSTRPGITFNEEGICAACQSYERRKSIDWDARFEELKKLCDKYRGMNGNGYDCAIAVSGGKDSHYQVYLMKEVMHMNPILFSVEDNFAMTEAGKHNIKNISYFINILKFWKIQNISLTRNKIFILNHFTNSSNKYTN